VTPSQLALEQIDASLVMDFLADMESRRGNCARTRNTRLAAIKSFMRFVEHRVPSVLEQSLRVLAIPTKKTDTPLLRYLSVAEVQAILNVPDSHTRAGIRGRAMRHLGFAAGLRVSELVGLPLSAVALQPVPAIRVMGKGRKERSLPLWKQTANDLRAWLSHPGEWPRYGKKAQGMDSAERLPCWIVGRYPGHRTSQNHGRPIRTENRDKERRSRFRSMRTCGMSYGVFGAGA
jgi:integrase/recombinase XerD